MIISMSMRMFRLSPKNLVDRKHSIKSKQNTEPHLNQHLLTKHFLSLTKVNNLKIVLRIDQDSDTLW